MNRLSLENSYNENQSSQAIQQSLLTKEYVERVSDQCIDYLQEMIGETNPKKLYEITMRNKSKKADQYDQMLSQNRRLHNQVITLSAQVRQLRIQNQRLSSNLQNSEYLQQSIHNYNSSEVKGQQSHRRQNSGQNVAVDFNLSISQSKKKLMEGIDNELMFAKKIQVLEVQQIRKIQHSIEILMEKIDRIVDFNKFEQSIEVDRNYPKKIVEISEDKYKKLLDFYFKHSLIKFPQQQSNNTSPKPKSSSSDGQEESKVQQFNLLQKQQNLSQRQNQTTQFNVEQLKQLFTEMAHQNGYEKQWKYFLANTEGQAQKFKSEIESIAKCDFDQNKKEKSKKIIKNINESKISKNDEQSTMVETEEKQLEEILFLKITKLLHKLSFNQRQLDLFYEFDQKRKNDRLFSVNEFINKFKNKQDLVQISKQYTLKFLQTLNLLIMKILLIITNISPSEQDRVRKIFEWFKNKFDVKSNQVRINLSSKLEKVIEEYLNAKNPKNGRSKNYEPIPTLTFDTNKEFEKELIRIVSQYERLFESCIFNCRKQIKWILN